MSEQNGNPIAQLSQKEALLAHQIDKLADALSLVGTGHGPLPAALDRLQKAKEESLARIALAQSSAFKMVGEVLAMLGEGADDITEGLAVHMAFSEPAEGSLTPSEEREAAPEEAGPARQVASAVADTLRAELPGVPVVMADDAPEACPFDVPADEPLHDGTVEKEQAEQEEADYRRWQMYGDDEAPPAPVVSRIVEATCPRCGRQAPVEGNRIARHGRGKNGCRGTGTEVK